MPITYSNNTITGVSGLYNTSNKGINIDSNNLRSLTDKVGFIAYTTTAIDDVYLGVDVIMPFNAVLTNWSSSYNTSTYRFTAPVSGMYWFSLNNWKGPSVDYGWGGVVLKVNGTQKGEARWAGSTGGSDYSNILLTRVQYLTAGDYVEPWTNADAGNGTWIATERYSKFCGFLIG